MKTHPPGTITRRALELGITIGALRARRRRWGDEERALSQARHPSRVRRTRRPEPELAMLLADARNRKLGRPGAKVATTYASIRSSCPRSCPLLDSGCYGQGGLVGAHAGRFLIEDGVASPLSVARAEARAIYSAFGGGPVPQDGARGGRDLRLHTVGDARTARAAELLGHAATSWVLRGGGWVWTYTHAWSWVPRRAWGPDIAVLASVESTKTGQEALRRGYAPAITIAEFPRGRRAWRQHGVLWIPCPAQTSDVACVDCRLCFDDGALTDRSAGIALRAHGDPNRRRVVLRVLQGALAGS